MLQPNTKVDRFIVEALVAKGTTSEVYRVRHAQLGTHHALKLLKEGGGADLQKRMEREARLQARLRHPNIVPVTDIVEADGRFGLIQDYVEGPTLRQALKRFSLDLRGALGLFQGIVAGVRCAHAHGLVHRDLKPENIVLLKTQDGYVPKITDFGLTKQLFNGDEEVAQTRVGITMGTPGYMAPEQSLDARVADQRADIFSLGCLLYEMVTGHRTFAGETNLELLRATQCGAYDSPLLHNPELPAAVCRTIDGCLAVERNQRFSDCDGMLAVLHGQENDTGTIVPTQMNFNPESEGSTLTDMTWFVPEEDVRAPQEEEFETARAWRPRRLRALALASVLMVTTAAAAPWVGSLTDVAQAPAQEVSAAPSKTEALPVQEKVKPQKTKRVRRRAPKSPSLLVSAKSTSPPAKKNADKSMDSSKRRARMAALVSAVAVEPGHEVSTTSRSFETKILTQPPAAQIRVDGRIMGRSPMKIALEAGQHEVQVESDGSRRSFVIAVDSREANRWCYEFERDVFRKGRCVL